MTDTFIPPQCHRCHADTARYYMEVYDPSREAVVTYWMCRACAQMASDMTARFMEGRR